MYTKTAIAGAALAAVAAAAPLPQIVTTITQPNNGGLRPSSSYGYGGWNRPSWGNSWGNNDWGNTWSPRPWNIPVGWASLGLADSSTTINGGDPFANYGGYYNNDDYYKRTSSDAVGAASLNLADSTTTITKRSEESLGNKAKRQFNFFNPAGGWQAWLDYLNGVNNNVVGTSSLGIAGSTFNIDNGYPAPAYPIPAYPGAGYSGPAIPLAFPYAASSGSSSLTIV